jgi:hypothetical protein
MESSSETTGDDDFRTEISSALKPDLRLYRRLWFANSDLEEAKEVAEELLRLRLPIPRRDRGPPLLTALGTALVVSYARPFVNSRGDSSFADRTVPRAMLRVLTKNQRAFHDALIDLRNQRVAHSDVEVTELYLRLSWDGDSAIFRYGREPFRRNELRYILGIIKKLSGSIELRCEEIRTRLPRNVWI